MLGTHARYTADLLAIVLVTMVLLGGAGVAQGAELPFDYPASGSEILCYINGLEEIDEVPVVRPPIPTFDVGTCATPAPPPAPACSNGVDDDGDGKTDFPNDPGCSSATDDDETDEENGGNEGGEEEASPTPPPSSGGSGGGGGGGKKSSATSTGIVLGFSTTTESCDRYLTAFIREGYDNDVDQVKRLQRFLRDFEGAQVQETGIYDAATLAAVHAFQTKYAAQILTPWGISESTGFVYLTTRKQVNEIVCRFTKTFPLTVDELKKIEEVRAAAGMQGFAVKPAPAQPQPSIQSSPAATNQPGAAATGSTPWGNVFDFLRGVWEQYR